MTTNTQSLDLEALRKFAEAATPGPWLPMDLSGDVWRMDHPRKRICEHGAKYNAAFIAAANPPPVLDLIAEVERARDGEKTERQKMTDKGERLHKRLANEYIKLYVRISELEAALEPFAKEYRGKLALYGESDDSTGIPIMWGHLRNAAKAVQTEESDE